MARKERTRPRYSLHKATGQARVVINGKDHYLGKYDSRESHERYEELITEWILAHEQPAQFDLTVNELCLVFVEHAVAYYRRKDGTPTGTIDNIRDALRYVVELYGHTPHVNVPFPRQRPLRPFDVFLFPD